MADNRQLRKMLPFLPWGLRADTKVAVFNEKGRWVLTGAAGNQLKWKELANNMASFHSRDGLGVLNKQLSGKGADTIRDLLFQSRWIGMVIVADLARTHELARRGDRPTRLRLEEADLY